MSVSSTHDLQGNSNKTSENLSLNYQGKNFKINFNQTKINCEINFTPIRSNTHEVNACLIYANVKPKHTKDLIKQIKQVLLPR